MINIPLRVKNLIRKHGTALPRAVAGNLGFTIIEWDDLPPRINGLWRKVAGRKYICVQEKLPGWAKEAVIAHELGHFFLHKGYKNFSVNGRTYFCNARYEGEANAFAAEFMRCCSDMATGDVLDFLANGWKRGRILPSVDEVHGDGFVD